MLLWIIGGIIVYLLIGTALLVMACRDPWGGLVLEIWYLVIFLWPIMIIMSLINSRR